MDGNLFAGLALALCRRESSQEGDQQGVGQALAISEGRPFNI